MIRTSVRHAGALTSRHDDRPDVTCHVGDRASVRHAIIHPRRNAAAIATSPSRAGPKIGRRLAGHLPPVRCLIGYSDLSEEPIRHRARVASGWHTRIHPRRNAAAFATSVPTGVLSKVYWPTSDTQRESSGASDRAFHSGEHVVVPKVDFPAPANQPSCESANRSRTQAMIFVRHGSVIV